MEVEKIPATVGILTFNSGKVIRRALQSVSDFADIILCDGGSTDDTIAIAKEFGARVIAQSEEYKNPDGTLKHYGGVRNQCLDAARFDWFLYIDSDESISPGLRDEIREIVTNNTEEPLVYQVPLQIFMEGKRIRYSSNYPGYQTRFFNKRSGARFIRSVHERIEFDRTTVPVGKVQNPWHTHTSRYEWEHYLSETAAHRQKEIRERIHQPFRDYVVLALGRNIRRSIAVIVKATYMYLRHGFRETLPLQAEFGRALAPLIVAWGITAGRFHLPFGLLKKS